MNNALCLQYTPPIYFHTSLNLAMHGMFTVSLARQHEELPEYVNVGLSARIPLSRLEPITVNWRVLSLRTQKISWQAVRQK